MSTANRNNRAVSVRTIKYKQAMEWCLQKHYAHRKPMYQHAFGLVIGNQIEGDVEVYSRVKEEDK